MPVYKRIIIKVSGEFLGGDSHTGIQRACLDHLVSEIGSVARLGVEIGIVIGGGNFFRGRDTTALNIDSVKGDAIGMMATVMNGLALREALLDSQISASLVSAVAVPTIVDGYDHCRVLKAFASGTVVVFCAGTGHPCFTTDTAAALRAVQCGAECLVKGTKVDGVYSTDPVRDKHATFLKRVSYVEVISKNLDVMDMASIAICMENNLPIHVLNITKKGSLSDMLTGKEVGTTVMGR